MKMLRLRCIRCGREEIVNREFESHSCECGGCIAKIMAEWEEESEKERGMEEVNVEGVEGGF